MRKKETSINFNFSFIIMIPLLLNSWFTLVHSKEIFELYNGVRQMGLGGAAIALVNDETSILTNPAGLGKVRDLYLTVIDPEIEGSTNVTSVVTFSNFTRLTDPQGLLNSLQNRKGKYFYLKGQILPSVVLSNFGIGVLGKTEVAGEIDSSNTYYRYHYTNDLGIILAYNFRIWDGRIKLGFNGKFINRVEMNHLEDGVDTLNPTATNYTKSGLAVEGGGISADVGMIFSLPWAWIPTLALVGRDVGGTRYDLTGGLFYRTSTRPDPVSQSVDMAIALFPILGNRTRTSFSIEYRDILTASQETDHYRRAHVGLEFNFSDLLFLRFGMNQRYWTSGLEFAMERMQFQIATYGEEIGTAATPREDRRVVGKFAFRF